MTQDQTIPNRDSTRRAFLKTTTATCVAGSVTALEGGRAIAAESTQQDVEGPLAVVSASTDSQKGVIALNTETGDRVWTYRLDRDFDVSPTVVDGTVYAPDTTPLFTADGSRTVPDLSSASASRRQPAQLHAIDAATGEKEWVTELGGGLATGPPTIIGGTAYLSNGVSRDAEGQGFFAVDTETAEVQWSETVDQRPSLAGVQVIEGLLYGVAGERLIAVETETGAREWDLQLNADTSVGNASPVVYDGVVYVGHGSASFSPITDEPFGTLHAVDAETGEEQWRLEGFDDQVTTPPVYADGLVYVGSARQENSVTAVDAATGEIEWQFSDWLGNRDTGAVFGPAVVDDIAYVCGRGAGNNNVYALDAKTGEERWSFYDIDRVIYTCTPTVYENTLYVCGSVGRDGREHRLRAFDLEDREFTWETELERDSLGSVTPAAIVPDPDTGRSEDSRTTSGVFGHHQAWIDAQPTAVEPSVDDYCNENDVVDTPGLRAAIEDWRNDEITTSLLRAVIAAWRNAS